MWLHCGLQQIMIEATVKQPTVGHNSWELGIKGEKTKGLIKGVGLKM